ncbi:putative cytochrome [Armadillidium nasatum]|uniref:Putative cytochrome n=1 Tax=Armadillidium nasatum TaxID=96803 RepID=A0A5N5TJW5_9CRUS|nr:putative cytochrome [Armadillidium nasatum]
MKDWEGIEGEGGRLLTSETYSRRDMEVEARNNRLFTKIFTLTQILGVTTLLLIIIWLSLFRNGFAWTSNPKLEFNWHPLFMVLGLVFLYANDYFLLVIGALVYRAFRGEMKKKLKIIHASFHFFALIFAVIGLQAVFDSHNLNVDGNGNPSPTPNLYSLHSWMGLTVVILLRVPVIRKFWLYKIKIGVRYVEHFCKWLVGLLTFLFPGMRPAIRTFYMPVHQYFGISIFVGAVATALMGLNEKAFFAIKDYSLKSPEGILVNMIGFCLIVFAGLVVYLTANSSFKRRATEDEVLLTDTVLE